VTWEITSGSLPAGLTLSPPGTISGTPTAVGSSTFTIKATAKEKNFGPTRIDSKQFTINVGNLAARASRTLGEVGVAFRSTLSASGGQAPYSWSATSTPAGLTVSSKGVVTGVPTRAGSYTMTVQVTDANGVAKEIQMRIVVRQRLMIVTKQLPAAGVGAAYRVKLRTGGGVEGLRFSATNLPKALRLNPRTGAITGSAAAVGSYRVTFRVRDALGAIAKKTLLLRVG
jgi:hypothetical protein